MVAEPFAVEAFGIDGAVFVAEPDPETNFRLFGPVASAGYGPIPTSRAFALRLRPNQDFAGALEAFCRRARYRARQDTRRRRQHNRRAFYRRTQRRAVRNRTRDPLGHDCAWRGGTLEAELDVALVDYLGGLAEGRLMRGDNPVLMTMELVLEAV